MTPEMSLQTEQISRECQQDQQADAQELAVLPDASPTDNHESIYQPTCEQCVNWRPTRTVTLANGNTAQVGGFCELRAAADLEQMPQEYAAKCSFYEEEEPF